MSSPDESGYTQPAQEQVSAPVAPRPQPTTQPFVPVPQKPGWGDFLLGLLGQALLCAVVASACLYVYDQHFATKVVAMNVKQFLKSKEKAFTDGKISEEELAKELLKVKRTIAGVPGNKVIILDEVVVGNAETRTIE